MRHVISICCALLIGAPTAATAHKIVSLPKAEVSTDDFDGMLKRRLIRILVVPNRTYFYLHKGESFGLTAEISRHFEKWINKRHQKKPYKIDVALVPTKRETIGEDLKNGKGDIAAANLTITDKRSELVDFSEPWLKDVKEIFVTGPSAPSITTMSDLGGRDVTVRKLSSYYTHLVALNERLKQEGHKPINIVAADETLEDEDLLEMVSAGLLPWTVVDDHMAKLWSGIFKNLSRRDDLAVNEGGEIAWAIRKNSPLLQRELNEFISTNRKLSSDLISYYLYDGKPVRNALAPDQAKKFHEYVGYFRKYGEQYKIDPYMLAAQAYQESAFDQKLRMKSGAVGVMQMMPKTARDELKMHDIVTRAEDNIHSGAAYLRVLIEKYVNDPAIPEREKVWLVLAAYNAGPGNLRKFQKKARQDGFDPNVWFGNVEYGAAAIVGQETVQYIGNINKYYFVYSTILSQQGQATGEIPKDKK
jgi:membrane-bound lytic murein transglycosylase MltF